MIQRNAVRIVAGLSARHPLVLVEGPPRCGKTTMARQLATGSSPGAILANARLRDGRDIVAAPRDRSAARPVILDDAGPADAAAIVAAITARNGSASDMVDPGQPERSPRFVLVGGPFGGEDYGGAQVVRIEPLSLFETGAANERRLWLRGGYPEAFGAASESEAFAWLEAYAADLAFGSLVAWGLPREPGRLRRLLGLVAESNGLPFNENAAARAMGVSRPTVGRYLDALERAGILFTVPPLPARLTGGVARARRSPVSYLRDPGLFHALLGIRSGEELLARPRIATGSWAGFVVAQAMGTLPACLSPYRYISADGASLDLVVVANGIPVMAAVARRHRPDSVDRSASYAARALSASLGNSGIDIERYVVVPDGERRAIPGGFVAIGLAAFLERLAGR